MKIDREIEGWGDREIENRKEIIGDGVMRSWRRWTKFDF
jgi:hypothetical protein